MLDVAENCRMLFPGPSECTNKAGIDTVPLRAPQTGTISSKYIASSSSAYKAGLNRHHI